MYHKIILFPYTVQQVIEVINNIPVGVTTLDLSVNHFHSRTGTELAQVFAAIPVSVISLDLSYNGLYRKTGAELGLAFAAIPASVTFLNLSSNFFYLKPGAALGRAFATIPASVTSLDLSDSYFFLSDSYFFRTTGTELAQVFSGIPPHIKTIDLRNNKLFINKSTLEKNDSLQALGKDRGRFILADNGESDLARALAPMVALKLPIEIAGHILSFLPTDSVHQSSQTFYKKQLKATERHIDQIMNVSGREERKERIIAANTAITNYLSWSEGESNLRGRNGFFTWIRHGQAGRERAEALRDKINRGDPADAIKEFLKHPNTRYHRHSLASFLIDELLKTTDSAWEKTNDYPEYKP